MNDNQGNLTKAEKIASETINQIIEALNKTVTFLSNEYKVKEIPLSSYYLVNDRLLVPKDNVDHTILLRGFELNTIKSFTSLFTNLFSSYSKNDNTYEEFSFRTLHDISFKKLAILYSKNIDKKDKEKYKIISIFDDFFYIYRTFPQWLKVHKKLLKEKRELFAEKERSQIDTALSQLDKNTVSSNKLIRNLLLNTEKSLVEKVVTLEVFNDNNLKLLYRGYSKLLHGDIPFLIDLFSKKDTDRLIYRKTYFLLSSGLNALLLISDTYPQLKIDTETIQKNYAQVCILLTQHPKFI